MRPVPLLLTCIAPLFLHAQAPINGPMPGYSEFLEGIVWVQAKKACGVSMEYWKEDAPAAVFRTAPVQAMAENAFAVDLIADQVEPASTYRYRILLDGMPVDVPDTLRFHTQALWKFRTDPPAFTVATGSCAYINEPAFDRPGKPYGGGLGIFNSIADQRPDLMLWLGDNVYLREPDWGTWTGFLHRYTHTRSTPELQRLLRSTHHYAIWDDHDFGPNDADGSFVGADMALRAFDLFWPDPAGRAPGVGGTTTMFSYADVDFFLLDDRTFRIPPDVRTSTPTLLGEAQIDWLIRSLRYSDAAFKVVAMGGQFLNPAAVFENYATFPEERQRILDRLDREGLKDVVFLTGDRHHTVLSSLELKGGTRVYDLTVSPLTSGVHSPKEENPLAVEGTLVEQRNFATLHFRGPKGARELVITVRDADGKLLWERVINAQA